MEAVAGGAGGVRVAVGRGRAGVHDPVPEQSGPECSTNQDWWCASSSLGSRIGVKKMS